VKAALLGMTVMTVMTGAALGQESIHAKTYEPMSAQTIRMPPVPTVGVIKTVPTTIERRPPVPIAITPMPLPSMDSTVVIRYGRGGRLDEHTLRFADYRRNRTKVEIRGPCYSACTIVLSYVDPADLCIAPGAFMAFHAVRSAERREYMRAETEFLYTNYPLPIRQWIDRTGGWQNLPLDGDWPMSDRELWAMGYPRCAP